MGKKQSISFGDDYQPYSGGANVISTSGPSSVFRDDVPESMPESRPIRGFCSPLEDDEEEPQETL